MFAPPVGQAWGQARGRAVPVEWSAAMACASFCGIAPTARHYNMHRSDAYVWGRGKGGAP